VRLSAKFSPFGGNGPGRFCYGQEVGLMTMQTLGANMAWLLKKINK
jgi:hypothetical protein